MKGSKSEWIQRPRRCPWPPHLSQVELYLDGNPPGNRLSVPDCGFESHLIGGADGFFIQSVRQASRNRDPLNRPIGPDQHSGPHDSLHLILSSGLRIVRSRPIQRHGCRINAFVVVSVRAAADGGRAGTSGVPALPFPVTLTLAVAHAASAAVTDSVV